MCGCDWIAAALDPASVVLRIPDEDRHAVAGSRSS